jgi:hypothetical protein
MDDWRLGRGLQGGFPGPPGSLLPCGSLDEVVVANTILGQHSVILPALKPEKFLSAQSIALCVTAFLLLRPHL